MSGPRVRASGWTPLAPRPRCKSCRRNSDSQSRTSSRPRDHRSRVRGETMRVAIGCDHAGFELKEAVKGFIVAGNSAVLDVGTRRAETVGYSDFAAAVGEAVS